VDDVTIYDDPAIGLEPVVYIQEPGSLEVVPSIWSLLGGRFQPERRSESSLRLPCVRLPSSAPTSHVLTRWGQRGVHPTGHGEGAHYCLG
jgi:hypothetical protein